MERSSSLFVCLLACAACSTLGGSREAVSLEGADLRRIVPGVEAERALERRLENARADWQRAPSEESAIWVGRTLAYLGRYREAIDWYGRRLGNYPESFKLLRHRGHRLISVREFEAAERDLQLAFELCRELEDEVEPDGAPNRYGIPRSTTQTNVLYHLALARYLQGEYRGAAEAWSECLARCSNDDMRVATSNWLYHALRRSGAGGEARRVALGISPDARVIENTVYLKLLLVYSARLSPGEVLADAEDGIGDATAEYGLAAWTLANGDVNSSRERMQGIVSGTPWNAFGHIAAEADLARKL